MDQDGDTLSSLFGEVIHQYTRSDASGTGSSLNFPPISAGKPGLLSL